MVLVLDLTYCEDEFVDVLAEFPRGNKRGVCGVKR